MLNFRKTLLAVGLVAMCATTAMAQGTWSAGAAVTSAPNATFIRQEGVTESLPPITVSATTYSTITDGSGAYTIQGFINPVNGVQPLITSGNDSSAKKFHEIVLKDAGGSPLTYCPVAANGLSFTCTSAMIAEIAIVAGQPEHSVGFTISGLRVNATALSGASLSVSSGITFTLYAHVDTSAPATHPDALFAGSPIYTTNPLGYAVTAFSQSAPTFQPTLAYAGVVSVPDPAPKLKVLPVCNNTDPLLGTDITIDPFTAPVPLVPLAAKAIAAINLTGISGAFTLAGVPGTAGTEGAYEYHDAGGIYNATTNAGGLYLNYNTNSTRIAVTFSNIPTGVSAYVPWKVSNATGTLLATVATKLATDGSGTATLATAAAPYFAVTNGSTLFYQITAAPSGGGGTLNVPLVVTIANGTIPPAVASAVTVGAQLAPISSASSTAIPRFAGTVQSQSGFFGTGLCSTTLLFPYVTTQPGGSPWNTGIAIANTSTDPFSTAGQAGVCSMYFYGADGTGAATTKNVSFGAATVAAGGDAFGSTTAIASGTVATGLISSTNAFGTGTFSGYAVAVCNFQYAHGYSFVIGTNAKGAFSNGYLALVLGSGSGTPLNRGANNGQFEQNTF